MPPNVINSSASRRQAGFTLVELMITLMVLAVIVTLVVPGFNTLIRNNRMYTQVNDFHLALMRARSEAMSRVQRVTICASADGASCSGTGRWEDGWVIFAEDPNDQDAQIDISDGDEILAIQQALSGDTTLRGSPAVGGIDAFEDYVSYVGTGFTATATKPAVDQVGYLVLCDSRGLQWSRTVEIKGAGRPRVLYSDDSGSATTCTP